jgi:hypothetical protein
MNIDSSNPAVVVVTKMSNENHDVEKAEMTEKFDDAVPETDDKLEEGSRRDNEQSDELPFSKARLVGLVLCLSLAAFLNVSFTFHFSLSHVFIVVGVFKIETNYPALSSKGSSKNE